MKTKELKEAEAKVKEFRAARVRALKEKMTVGRRLDVARDKEERAHAFVLECEIDLEAKVSELGEAADHEAFAEGALSVLRSLSGRKS